MVGPATFETGVVPTYAAGCSAFTAAARAPDQSLAIRRGAPLKILVFAHYDVLIDGFEHPKLLLGQVRSHRLKVVPLWTALLHASDRDRFAVRHSRAQVLFDALLAKLVFAAEARHIRL